MSYVDTFSTLYGPYILESVVHDGFAFIDTGGFPYVKYGNNWHVNGSSILANSFHFSELLEQKYRLQMILSSNRYFFKAGKLQKLGKNDFWKQLQNKQNREGVP